MVPGDTLVPQRASVMSATRRTETPAKYISLDQCLFNGAFTTLVTLYDGSFELNALELGNPESHIT